MTFHVCVGNHLTLVYAINLWSLIFTTWVSAMVGQYFSISSLSICVASLAGFCFCYDPKQRDE